MLLLDKRGLLQDTNVSVTTSHPLSVISKSSSLMVTTDRGESLWEEALKHINNQSNMTLNSLGIMLLTGFVAVIGIVTNALHVVVGAMVTAPGFESITWISLGLTTNHYDWKHGLIDTLKGYAVLLAGAMVSALVMQLLGKDIIEGSSSYLPAGALLNYWTSITTESLLISAAAAVAGAFVIITNWSVLTAGVMIALALVPATSITGMGLVAGEFEVAGKAFTRLLLDMGLVAVFTALVFLWKRATVQKRRMQA